jgi:hypothetical protein
MSAIWLTNQFVGFVFFHFPRTMNTVWWGLAIGAAALLSAVAASIVIKRTRLTLLRLGFGLLISYSIYQMTLLATALVLGSLETFSPHVIVQLGLINLVWFVGLVALNELVAILCKTWLGVTPRLLQAS